MELFCGDTLIYTMKTGFGFFLKAAFDQQFGIPMTDEQKQAALAEIQKPSEADMNVDLTQRPARYCDGELRLPGEMLLMLDRVTGYWPKAGEKGLGRLRGEKDINPKEWFFKAHFFQDPVQPGSLGVEALIQLLQFYMIHENMHEGIEEPRFEAIGIDKTIGWKYRGQAVPKNKIIVTELEIGETGRDEKGPYAIAQGWLWIDGLRTYHVKDMYMRIVSGGGRDGGDEVTVETTAEPAEPEPEPGMSDADLQQNLAKQMAMPADMIKVDRAAGTFSCRNMPVNVFPFEVSGHKTSPQVQIGETSFILDKLVGYGRDLLGHPPCLIEDFSREMFLRFSRNLVIEDHEAFEKIRDRGLLYLANHQVQIESMFFTGLTHYLNDAQTIAIANATHKQGWMGPLNELAYAYPLVEYPRNIVYFDQGDQQSMFGILDEYKKRIIKEGVSVFIHCEGKLALTCREPVRNLSSVFIDMALDCRLPIVPVRLTGALPVEPMESTRDFPMGYCKQDYHIGRPIMPEELEAMPYAERRKVVMAAINGLGPLNSEEVPLPPDPDFAREVEAWMQKTGVPEVQAVMYKTLENARYPLSDETKAILDLVQKDKPIDTSDARGKWLEQFSRWLYGDER